MKGVGKRGRAVQTCPASLFPLQSQEMTHLLCCLNLSDRSTGYRFADVCLNGHLCTSVLWNMFDCLDVARTHLVILRLLLMAAHAELICITENSCVSCFIISILLFFSENFDYLLFEVHFLFYSSSRICVHTCIRQSVKERTFNLNSGRDDSSSVFVAGTYCLNSLCLLQQYTTPAPLSFPMRLHSKSPHSMK